MAYFQVFITLCFLSLALANTLSFSESATDDCPLICQAIYKPVCATDGFLHREFSNACELKANNCLRQRNALTSFKETDYAWCSSELVENLQEKLGNIELSTAGCLKPCTMIYQPVCVTNGKYRGLVSNNCAFENLNCALEATGAKQLLRVLRQQTC